MRWVDQLKNKNIIFTGRRYCQIYGKAGFTILTSISEGQPLSVLNLFAARRPCVTTDVDAAELLKEARGTLGRAGYYVAPMYREGLADAMEKLKSEPRRRRMGENAQNRVKTHYKHEDMMENYYRKVCTGRLKRKMAGIGFELEKLFSTDVDCLRHFGLMDMPELYVPDQCSWELCFWSYVFVWHHRWFKTQQRASGMYDHIYCAGIPDCHKFSFYGGHQIYC